MKIERIVNSFLQSNTFILSQNEEDTVYVVDIGDINPVLELIGPKRVKGLFLTHAHYDHIYGINTLLATFPECIVYGSKQSFNALKNDKLNFSYYYDTPLQYQGGTEIVMEDGQMVALWKGSNSIQAFITPGHTHGSTCYITGNNIFTGDAYIPNISPVTKLKEGNKIEAMKSIEAIKARILEGIVIHPGHLTQYKMINGTLKSLEY